MKHALITIAVLYTSVLYAQPDPPDTLWTNFFGGIGNEAFQGVCQSPGGDFLLVGYSRVGSSSDVYLICLEGGGTPRWTRTFGGTLDDKAFDAAPVGSDGYIIVGNTQSFGSFPGDCYVIRVTNNGDTLWTKRLGWSSSDYAASDEALSVLALSDGGYLIAGSSFRSASNVDGLLMRLDANGDTLWTRFFGGTGIEKFNHVAPANDGGFVLSGLTTSIGPNGTNFYLVRTNANGILLWERAYGSAMSEEACAAIQTSDLGYILGGFTTMDVNSWDYYLVKTNPQGDTTWTRRYAGSNYDRPYALALGRDNGYLLAGSSNSFGAGNHDMYLLKVNDAGTLVWQQTHGGASNDYLYAMETTNDGGFICAGMSNTFTHGNYDGYVVRLAGFSGVGGVVRDIVTNNPVPGVQVSAVGQGTRVTTDSQGHYVLTLAPGFHDVIFYGQCVGRDTAFQVEVIQDSISELNHQIGLPDGVVLQSSMNIVAPNHGVGVESLLVRNAGVGVLDYRIEAFATDPPGSWLLVAPQAGTIPEGGQQNIAVEVHADTSDDGVFDYFGHLLLHMNSCPDSVVRVEVTAAVYNSADDFSSFLPQEFSITAYPNPFNPATTLEITLPHDSPVSLRIYDITGREVRNLTDQPMTAGRHRIQFNASSLSTGLYFARMTTPESELSTKLLLLK